MTGEVDIASGVYVCGGGFLRDILVVVEGEGARSRRKVQICEVDGGEWCVTCVGAT